MKIHYFEHLYIEIDFIRWVLQYFHWCGLSGANLAYSWLRIFFFYITLAELVRFKNIVLASQCNINVPPHCSMSSEALKIDTCDCPSGLFAWWREEWRCLSCAYAQGQMRHASHDFCSAMFAQCCECELNTQRKREAGARLRAVISYLSGVPVGASARTFLVPVRKRQEHLPLLRHGRISTAANVDMTTFATFIDASVSPSAPDGGQCEVILFVRSNASLSLRRFIHPLPRCHITEEVWSQPFTAII